MAKGWQRVRTLTTERVLAGMDAIAAQEERDREEESDVHMGLKLCPVCKKYHDLDDFDDGDPHRHDGSYF